MGFSRLVDMGSPQLAQDPLAGVYENLGVMVRRVIGVDGVAFDGPDGTPFISVTVDGAPAQYVVLNARSLDVVKVMPIPGAPSACALVVGEDGKVYIGASGSGDLFRYTPGEDLLEPLGKGLPGESHIYDLVKGPDGKLYGGTYPGGKMFVLDPVTKTVQDLGVIVPGERYVRSLAYDEGRRLFYVGTGTSNRLVEYDPATGHVSVNFMPESLKLEEYPNSIDLFGDKLFIQLNKTATMIIMDKKTKAIEYRRSGVTPSAIRSPDGSKAYMYSPKDACIHVYDFRTGQVSETVNLGKYNSWRCARFIPDDKSDSYLLTAWVGYSYVINYNMKTGEKWGKGIDIPKPPVEIRSIAGGPDGRVYTTGKLGGLGIYDPATGEKEAHESGISQGEGITVIGSVLYIGVYPSARVSVFDTAKPWQAGNPQEVAKLPFDDLQDRPFGMASALETGKVYIGTVPQYGQLGGAFGIYDTTTRSLATIRNLVQDQSIIALVHLNGKVYGGTSIWGAYGAPDPRAAEGKLFVWDTVSGQKELEIAPVPGKQAVTAVIVGPDGKIWGLAEGVLFIFDPVSQAVVERHQVLDIIYTGTVWSDAFMLVGKDSNVYGTARGVFFRIDSETKQATILNRERKYSNVAQDLYGTLYMRSSIREVNHDLWSYTNPHLLIAGMLASVETHKTDGSPEQPLYAKLADSLQEAAQRWKKREREQTLHFLAKVVEWLGEGGTWNDEALHARLRSETDLAVKLVSQGL